MHTFFVNTSGMPIENVSDLLEIELENKKLVILDCPMSKWEDREDGFRSCAVKMGNLIDDYKELSSEYQLVIYVDLIADKSFSSIPMVKTKGQEIRACLDALHAYYEDLICDTLLDELADAERAPQQTMIVFEENPNPAGEIEKNDEVKKGIREHCRKFVGLPTEEALNDYFEKNPGIASDAGTDEFLQGIRPLCTPGLDERSLERYGDDIGTSLEERRAGNFKWYVELLERVGSHAEKHEFHRVLFRTKRRERSLNKMERARRGVRLCCYLIRLAGEEGTEDAFVPELDWKKVLLRLKSAQVKFGDQYRYTEDLSSNYSQLQMTPKLYRYYREMFGLDDSGHVGKSLSVHDVTAEKSENPDEGPVIRPKGKVTREQEKTPLRMLPEFRKVDPETGLKPDGDEAQKNGKRRKKADDKVKVSGGTGLAASYEAQALALREDHTEYLKRIHGHVLDAMSDYAGRSAENSPAILRKRAVSIAEQEFTGPEMDYRYTTPMKEEETEKFTAVKEFSETAYESILRKYLEFCVGRALAMTDIKALCDGFLTKLYGIDESLKKSRAIFCGLLAALFLLLFPFPLIQWPAITQKVVTVAVALGSFLAPFALLLAAFGAAVSVQKGKMRKEWKKYRQQADDVMADNRAAVEQYDRLLAEYIPALRWTYEYRLDVAFYEDCARLARSKIAHHMEKMHGRVNSIGNLIEDLEYEGSLEADSAKTALSEARKAEPADRVDYSLPFCKNEKNVGFYSVFSMKDVNDMIVKEGGENR